MLRRDIQAAVRNVLSNGNHFDSDEIEKISGMVTITLRGNQSVDVVQWIETSPTTSSPSSPERNGKEEAASSTPPMDVTETQDEEEHSPLDLSAPRVSNIRVKEEKPEPVPSPKLPTTPVLPPAHSPLPSIFPGPPRSPNTECGLPNGDIQQHQKASVSPSPPPQPLQTQPLSTQPLQTSTPHPSTPPHWQCSTCPKTFGSRYGLHQHEEAHRGIYKYMCPFCDKGFQSTTNLKEHTYTHTNIKEFVCSQCGDAFRYARALREHIQSVHQQQSRKRIHESNGW